MEYKRSTGKQRRLHTQFEPQVLVGFGDYSLIDLMKFKGSDQEENIVMAPFRGIARNRRLSICTEEEVSTFKAYAFWMKDLFQVEENK